MNYTLLTGATSSIGKEIAITLSKSNKLILMGRNAIELEELKELCFNSNNHFTYIIDFNDIDLLRGDFIEINEGSAIYYIGQFDFSNAENLRFNFEIQPEQSGTVYPISWTSQLYIN